MNCILCQVGLVGKRKTATPQQPTEYTRPPDHYDRASIPEPVIFHNDVGDYCDPSHYDGRGPAPGSRHPRLTDAKGGHRPGTPSGALRTYAAPVTRKSDVGPTDQVNPFTRTVAEGGAIRWVREQYVIPGGPAGPAQGIYGPIHNYGYLTIADTLKPAQQLPRYNYAATDPNTLVANARKSLLRTLYGIG